MNRCILTHHAPWSQPFLWNNVILTFILECETDSKTTAGGTSKTTAGGTSETTAGGTSDTRGSALGPDWSNDLDMKGVEQVR